MLGPILFLVFINDLPDCVQSPVRLFADDCVLYRTIDSPRDATQMQDDLNNLQKWEDKWLMEFHPDKCLTIRITNKGNIIKTDYQIHGQTLQTVDSAKYLGVNIQSKLNWSPHIATTARKADNTRAFPTEKHAILPPQCKEPVLHNACTPDTGILLACVGPSPPEGL